MVKEGHLLAIFNSTHNVMKAESILKGLGLPILLIPAPRQLQTDCGLAIRFTGGEHADIMRTLEQKMLLPAYISKYENGKYVLVWTNAATPAALEKDDLNENN